MKSSIIFTLLSGAGWFADLVIFSCLVTLLHFSPALSNIISSTIAAMTVHVISRRIIFKVKFFDFKYFMSYFIHTEFFIFVWSFLIKILSHNLSLYFHVDYNLSAILSKIIVTPLSLIINYLATMILSKKAHN